MKIGVAVELSEAMEDAVANVYNIHDAVELYPDERKLEKALRSGARDVRRAREALKDCAEVIKKVERVLDDPDNVGRYIDYV